MASVDLVTPVHFACTGAAPLDMAPGALAYYSVVPKDGTARSRVLSCNAEAGAGAGLPEAVSIAELRTWMTACQTDETKRRDIGFDTFIFCAQSVHVSDHTCLTCILNAPCALSHRRPSHRQQADLCTTRCPPLQVADAIGDKHMSQRAKVAAGFLEPRLEKAIQPFKETGER